jgi:hypothetical protein
MALPAHLGPWPLFQFRNHFSQAVGLLGRVISLSQDRYLNTGQHIHTPTIHALIGIRTHDPSVRASEGSSCLRPRGYCDQHLLSRVEKYRYLDQRIACTLNKYTYICFTKIYHDAECQHLKLNIETLTRVFYCIYCAREYNNCENFS